MRFLLDTHILIWSLDEKSPLKKSARAWLTDRKHELAVSVATLWEMSIKKALGRLESPDNILAILEFNGIQIIPIKPEHAYAVRSLPLLHRDPFDRMLVVQALMENLTIITNDKDVQSYAVPYKEI